jgi:hypothetical protein
MATANNNLTTNFNVDPYYDDYDETKNFHRILYRPGFAVQARELTQQQTILQNQIHRFGNHIFKDGSEVTGTSEVLDQTAVFRLKSSYAGTAIDVSTFDGKYARTRTSEKLFKVKKVVAAAGGDYDLVFAQYLQEANSVSIASPREVSNNEVIDFSSSFINSNTGLFFSNSGIAQVITTAQGSAAKLPVTSGYLYAIDESIYYHKGLFIRAPSQTVVVAANTSHKISIGFTSTETLISSDDDSALTDPARGSYNYAAPGADRLKVELTLTTKDLSDISSPPLTSNNFFEVARVLNGTFARKRPDPDYNRLGDVLAQRTFEESGHYTVDGFELTIANTSATTANLIAQFTPGTAYVKGYRVSTPNVTSVEFAKSRATDSATEQKITAYYGNYVVANTFTTGLFGFNDRIELHSNTTPTSATKVGEAHVRNVEYLSGSSDQRKYKLFLYDININATDNKVFNNVKSVIKGTHSSYTAYAAIHSDSITTFNKIGNITSGSATVDLTSSVAGVKVGQVIENNAFAANTIVSAISFDTITLSNQATVSNTASTITFRSVKLTDKDYNTGLFAMPHINVANTVNVDYKFKRKFASVSFTSGSATIQTLGGAERFSSGTGDLANENFIVVVKSGGAGTISTGENVDMTAGSRSVTVPTPTPGNPASATIDVDEASFNGTADIYAAIDVTADTRRAKTRQSGATKTIVGGYPVNGTKLSLGYADGIKLNAVYEGNSTFVSANSMSTLTTDKWIFNGGQRDNFYDHATIELKPGYTANSNHILVDFDYYSHGGGLGYFSDKSYPNYNLIPTYRNSKGEEINLRDVLDFRPTRSSNTSSYTYSSSKIFDNHQIVDSQTFEVEADYSYYKKVVHKISLDQNGNFIVTSGASALNYPPVPTTSGDTMLLATISVNPYTYDESDLKVELSDNSRYTMRDIGALETRIENLEYYTSLNLLESQVASAQFLDDNGEARYKNGFIVDSFTGHSVGDVFDTNYKVSIDRDNQILRPRFTSDSAPLTADAGATLTNTGNLVTVPYTEGVYVSQTIASGTINVNPFQVVVFTGLLKVTPDRDIWVDNISTPTVVDNFQGQLDHFKYLKSQEGYDYGNWKVISRSGENQYLRGSKGDKKYIPGSPISAYVTTTVKSRTVTKNSLQLTNSISYQFMRSRKINFTVEGCRPNTKMYVFMAGKNISSHAAPTSYASTRVEQVLYDASPSQKEIITDANGSASGYFWVPNYKRTLTQAAYAADNTAQPKIDLSNVLTHGIQIPVGTVDIMLSDKIINPENSTSFATATFTAAGTQKTYKLVIKKLTPQSVTKKTESDFVNEQGTIAQVNRSMVGVPSANPFDINNSNHIALANIVYNKYLNDRLINRKPDPSGYIYWTTTFLSGANSGGVLPTAPADFLESSAGVQNMLRNMEYAAYINSQTIPCDWGMDPLAQTFSVGNEFHPHGIFLTSVDVFMSTKDTTGLPLRVEIRPTVNGFPSAEEIVPGSQVAVNPDSITANATTPTATNIAFDSPVYLEPGDYAIVLLTDSLEYNTFICTVGEDRLDGTGVITQQPTLGSLFKSQNAKTWTPQQESDLCFRLNQAQFTTDTDFSITMSANNVGRVSYNASANTSGEYDLANIVMPKNDTFVPTTATYQIKTKTKGGSVGSFVNVLPNQDLYFDASKEISTNSDLQVKVTFRTSDADVSPFFKLDQSGVSLVKNIINSSPTGNFVAETTASDSYAIARYITRKVSLGDGLAAKSLKVFVDQNMPKGSSIEVYYRVINNEDIDNFEDRPYVLMTRRQTSTTVNQDVFTYNEYEYYADDISYTKSGISYDEFDAFSIKIVMYADNTAAAPTCRNFRAIALA